MVKKGLEDNTKQSLESWKGGVVFNVLPFRPPPPMRQCYSSYGLKYKGRKGWKNMIEKLRLAFFNFLSYNIFSIILFLFLNYTFKNEEKPYKIFFVNFFIGGGGGGRQIDNQIIF